MEPKFVDGGVSCSHWGVWPISETVDSPASSVEEQRTCNPHVDGSNPSPGTKWRDVPAPPAPTTVAKGGLPSGSDLSAILQFNDFGRLP